MDKGVCLFLNPETTKATSKKLSIETKISVSQPPQFLPAQSTKNSIKPTANSISSYRLMQYQRQANTLRNASGAAPGKRAPAKSRKINRTVGINKSISQKKQAAECSVRDSSIENSQRNDRLFHRVNTSKPVHLGNTKKHLQDSPKQICLLNSSVSTTQPISVNINISNHLVSAESTSTSPPRKSNPCVGAKPSILNLSRRISGHSTKALANTQSTKSMVGTIPQFHPTLHAQNQSTVGAVPSSTRAVSKGKGVALSNKSVVAADPVLKDKTSELTRIQSLLKASTMTSPKAAQTQRATLGTQQRKASAGSGSSTKTHQQAAAAKKPKASQSPQRVVDKSKEPAFPMSAAQALKLFASQLTDYEKGEILDYREIYFMGKGVARKVGLGTKDGGPNYGFDDDKGDYNAYVGEHIGYRYEIIDMLGKGSFGQAIKCIDHKTKETVALKIIRSKKRFYHQATVEVKILKYIRDIDTKRRSNVVKMLDYFTFRKHIVRFQHQLPVVHRLRVAQSQPVRLH